MKSISCNKQYTFSDPFILPDGDFGYVEQFDNILEGDFILTTVNLRTGKRYKQFKINSTKCDIFYTSKGLVLWTSEKDNNQYCDLLTGKKLLFDEEFSGITRETSRSSFCRSEKFIVCLIDFKNFACYCPNIISKIISNIENSKRNGVDTSKCIIISDNNGNNAKLFDVGFYPRSVLISPDNLTCLIGSQNNIAIVDLE